MMLAQKDILGRLLEEIALSRAVVGILCMVVTLSTIYYVTWKRKHSSYRPSMPPIVPGYPLLGNILDIDSKMPHLSLTELAGRFGDIYTIRILREDVVVVNSPELVRQVLCQTGHTVAGRPSFFRIDYGFHGAKDIIFGTYSPKWSYMKKLLVQTVRANGPGNRDVDSVVEKEMEALVEVFHQQDGGNFDPRLTLLTAVVNGITAMMIGRRYEHWDPYMRQYKEVTRLFSESCSPVAGVELDLFPWLRFFPNQAFRKLTHARDMLDQLVDRELQASKDEYDPGSIKCVLHSLMKQRDEDRKNENELAITDEDIRAIFIDLLVSGTFTTAIALSCFVLYMVLYPKLQHELRAEIDEHVGRGRKPSSGDKRNLPLMEATIFEILRYISHVPLNLPHFTMEATRVGAYTIPKNTQVLLNLWAVHHDERVWTDPWRFNPKRFLDADGQLLPPTDTKMRSFLAFSGGRRACIGETIARERILCYMCALLQQFKFSPPDGEVLPSGDPRDFDLGLILEPKPFSVRVDVL